MTTRVKALTAAAFMAPLLLSAAAVEAQVRSAQSPLDALTYVEIEQAVGLLKEAGIADDATRFPVITLKDPPKAEVLAWTEGSPMPRMAQVIMHKGNETTEAQVDLVAGTIVSTRPLPDVQPAIMQEEWDRARQSVLSDATFRKALNQAGITDTKAVSCTPMPPGAYPREGLGTRRVLRVVCYDDNQQISPYASRSIEGLMAIVDAATGKVIDIKVKEPVIVPAKIEPLPDREIMTRQKPIINAAPEGTNISIKGNWQVSWQNWSFHLRPDRRSGLVVSLARFRDRGTERMVAYQMELAELFVPYMDPSLGWSTRNYLDAGELGLGYLVSTLSEGNDCPAQSFYLDMLMPSDKGGMFNAPSSLCIFERATGSPAWRHYSGNAGETIARPEVELVVRYIPTIGNYDYIIDYVFSSRGTITVRTGATGVDAVKTVPALTLDDPSAPDDTRYGALVAPQTVAPYHDHYFGFRIDLDVDGPRNSLIVETMHPQTLDEDNARQSIWVLRQDTVKTEGPVPGGHHGSGAVWRVINPERKTPLGYHPGYEIMPEHGTATSLLPADDPAQRRAEFSRATLWVTRTNPAERYPAGDFPLVSLDEGLPKYAGNREGVENEDLTFWYTIGFRHVTRPEDWPILPTMWHSFAIRPYGFFDSDPSQAINPGVQP